MHKYNYKLDFSNCYSIGWRDTVKGLIAIKKQVIIATLSNGNVRLLIDMVIDLLPLTRS